MNRSYPKTSRIVHHLLTLTFGLILPTTWCVGYANPLDDLDVAERQINRENTAAKRSKDLERQLPATQPTAKDKSRTKRKRITKTPPQTKRPRKTSTRSKLKRITLSDSQWRERLSPEEYRVLRQKGTERKNSGIYLHNKKKGIYVCAACGHRLYTSKTKFDSGSGWPSFTKAIRNGIRRKPDRSHGMNRTEIVCARCESHLGHVFNDGPKPTGERHCINSISLKFRSKARR